MPGAPVTMATGGVEGGGGIAAISFALVPNFGRVEAPASGGRGPCLGAP